MQITRKLIVSNTLWSAVVQVGVILVSLLVVPLFINNLGAELYGIWVLSNVILAYVTMFDFGFTRGLQRYVAEARVNRDNIQLSEVVVSGLGLLLLIGVVSSFGFYVTADSIVSFFQIDSEDRETALKLLKISALFSVAMWPLRIVDVVLSASMRIKELSFLNAFKAAGQSLVMLGLISVGTDLVQIKLITAILLVISGMYGVVLVNKYVPEISWQIRHFRVSQLRRMHRFSLGMFYAAIIGMLAVQVDSLVIGKMLTMSAVAAYAIASKPYQLIQNFMMLAASAIQPAAYNLRAAKDDVRLEKLIAQGIRIRSVTAMPICVVAYFCIPEFIQIWVGADYLWVIPWARCFLLVPVLSCLGVGGQVCSTSSGGIVLTNVIGTFRSVLNLGLSVYLIGRFDIGGPVLGTVISFALLGSLPMCYVYCRYMNVSSRDGYRYFFFALMISMVGALLSLHLSQMMVADNLLVLLIKAAILSAIQVVLIALFLVNKEEKKLVLLRLQEIIPISLK
jgi:O-antigen/teichoic acid export membrane protein|tara:strand:+ start:945 stop:2468 length:1524 start_codon:yes stop_codon:yes gene_type:complete